MVHTFWPVTHPLVAVALGRGGERREVGAGARLAEQLAPHLLVAHDRRQEAQPLLLGAVREQRRRGEVEAERVEPAEVVRAAARRRSRARPSRARSRPPYATGHVGTTSPDARERRVPGLVVGTRLRTSRIAAAPPRSPASRHAAGTCSATHARTAATASSGAVDASMAIRLTTELSGTWGTAQQASCPGNGSTSRNALGAAVHQWSRGRRSDASGWRPMRSGLSGESTRRCGASRRRARASSCASASSVTARAAPRLLEAGPGGPVGDGPEDDRLGVVRPSPPGRRRPASSPSASTAGTRPRGRARRGSSPTVPAGTRHELVGVHLAPHAVGDQLLDRAGPRLGHDDAVDAAAAQRGGRRPPLGQRRVLVAARRRSRGRSWRRARPTRRAPTCSRPRASARSSRGWPTRRGTAGCAPRGRPGTSWPSCGACSGRGCAR